MEHHYLQISNGQLALATALILINVILSLVLRLGLERRLGIASLRMVIQLLLVGYILEWVFTLRNPLLILIIALAMTSMAGAAAVDRTQKRGSGVYWNSFISILTSSFLVTGLAVSGIIRVDPWYDPQYVIPLLGMVLGNSLTGVALALDRFTKDLVSDRDQIETWLALGATCWEAAHPSIQEAVRTGMIPTINSMLVMGLVSLPGMMTGQILAGASPLDAVRYQIVIIFMIASGTALGTISVVLLTFQNVFTPSHQLRLE